MNSRITFEISRRNSFTPHQLVHDGVQYVFTDSYFARHVERLSTVPYQRKGDNYYFVNELFVINGKLLEVFASSCISGGPLGNHTHMKVQLDGENIGELNAMRSYAGGGINGTYPFADLGDRIIVFSFDIRPAKAGTNTIDLYEKLSINHPLQISSGSAFVPDTDVIGLEDAVGQRHVCWEKELHDTLGVTSTIRFCTYDGYMAVRHVKLHDKDPDKKNKPNPYRVIPTKRKDCLTTLEISMPHCGERKFIDGLNTSYYFNENEK